MKIDTVVAVSLFALACVASVPGQAAGVEDPPSLTGASFIKIDQQLLGARGRPNEEARLRGLKSYTQSDYAGAVKAFERAAFYGDKFSQHYLSLMYWHGIGAPRDPVESYIWADLAAERMSRKLLLVREKIWQELTPAQRRQVTDRGEGFYARYGDDVAQPRAEAVMQQAMRDMTGSRVGWRGQELEITAGPAGGVWKQATGSNASDYEIGIATDPKELYGEEGGMTRVSTYWDRQDQLLEGGRVDVGPLAPAPERQRKPAGPNI